MSIEFMQMDWDEYQQIFGGKAGTMALASRRSEQQSKQTMNE